MQRTPSTPDETLAAEVLPPLLVLVSGITAAAFGLLLLAQWRASVWPYMLVFGFVGTIWYSSYLLRRKRIRPAGNVIAYSLGVLPILTITAFGLADNALIYTSVIGIICAGVLVSPRAPFNVARASLLTLALLMLFPNWYNQSYAGIDTILAIGLTMVVMHFGAAGLLWAVSHSIHGTITWALETALKSERREQLFREAQASLELAIRERDQLNDQLYRQSLELETARADAEAAYRSKSSFMATMSHELRTPLNIIIGFSTAMIEHPEMYEGQHLPEAACVDLNEIRRSGQHLLQLINDILDLARVEAGRLELNRTALPLVPLIDEIMRTTGGLLNERPVLLRREIRGPLPSVFADEIRVRQVLLNLISNACKFTSVGEVAIGANADQHDVTVWVRDTGIGIALVDQERVFRQFEQVENVDTRHHTGTGLGLAICRWMVELHGGRMWLESELGKGSIFYFTLPRVQSAATIAAATASGTSRDRMTSIGESSNGARIIGR
ncbi:MAG: two-component sensor histidine kinase [Oscillochloris sp.]|nr:two-component sensor histidine kinase [Oscillochloris sp.]